MEDVLVTTGTLSHANDFQLALVSSPAVESGK